MVQERSRQQAVGSALSAVGQQQQQALFGVHEEISKTLHRGRSLCRAAFERRRAQAEEAPAGFVVCVTSIHPAPRSSQPATSSPLTCHGMEQSDSDSMWATNTVCSTNAS